MRQAVIWAPYAITTFLMYLSLIAIVGMQYLIKFLICIHHLLESSAYTDNT